MDTPVNAEALAGLALKGPYGHLEACSKFGSLFLIFVAWVGFCIPKDQEIIRKKLPKGLTGLLGAKPARALAFIGVSILLDADALMPQGRRHSIMFR